MDINQLKNIFVNKTEALKSILNLKAGQLLWANVLSVKGNDLVLKIGAHVIEAKAQAYVKEGQLLRLLVEGVKGQEIRLKIVNEDNSVLKPEQSIAKAMGIRTNEIIEEVIKQMVRLRLPLSRETVLELTKLPFQQPSGSTNQNMKLTVGQELKAQLISINGREVVLNTNHGTIRVNSQLNLTQGQNLSLVVVNNEGKLGFNVNVIEKEGNVVTTQQFLGTINQEMDLKPSRLIQLASWLRTVNTEADVENLLKLNSFFKGQLDKKEEALFFQFLNTRENLVLGNYNIYGWSIQENHVYLMTQNHRKAKISPEQCFLVVKITSKAVGDLWFKIDYKNLFLNVSISCASDTSEAIVISEIETLKTALIGAGYLDLKITTKIEELDTILDFIPGTDLEDINYVNLQV